MTLKKGITGFHNLLKNDQPTFLTKPSFINWINNFALHYPFRIKEIIEPKHDSNYYRVKLVNCIENDRFDVLFNNHHPFFCGVTEDSQWMALKFIELSNNIRSLFESQFEYLEIKELERKPTSSELNKLEQIERDQVEYWKSETIGEIVFNGYD